jgi:hypothetical protein
MKRCLSEVPDDLVDALWMARMIRLLLARDGDLETLQALEALGDREAASYLVRTSAVASWIEKS